MDSGREIAGASAAGYEQVPAPVLPMHSSTHAASGAVCSVSKFVTSHAGRLTLSWIRISPSRAPAGQSCSGSSVTSAALFMI